MQVFALGRCEQARGRDQRGHVLSQAGQFLNDTDVVQAHRAKKPQEAGYGNPETRQERALKVMAEFSETLVSELEASAEQLRQKSESKVVGFWRPTKAQARDSIAVTAMPEDRAKTRSRV